MGSAELTDGVRLDSRLHLGGGGVKTLIDLVIFNNLAIGSGNNLDGFGGGIVAVDGTVRMFNSTVRDNQAQYDAGGVMNDGAYFVMHRNTFVDNQAPNTGACHLRATESLTASSGIVRGELMDNEFRFSAVSDCHSPLLLATLKETPSRHTFSSRCVHSPWVAFADPRVLDTEL